MSEAHIICRFDWENVKYQLPSSVKIQTYVCPDSPEDKWHEITFLDKKTKKEYFFYANYHHCLYEAKSVALQLFVANREALQLLKSSGDCHES